MPNQGERIARLEDAQGDLRERVVRLQDDVEAVTTLAHRLDRELNGNGRSDRDESVRGRLHKIEGDAHAARLAKEALEQAQARATRAADHAADRHDRRIARTVGIVGAVLAFLQLAGLGVSLLIALTHS